VASCNKFFELPAIRVTDGERSKHADFSFGKAVFSFAYFCISESLFFERPIKSKDSKSLRE
jgi:hypothetical protein